MSIRKFVQVVLGVFVMSMVFGALIHAQEDQAPLDIKLPKPMFTGTPKNIKSRSNLEATVNEKRPPFIAPKDVALISKGKPVTASDTQPVVGELKDITDGNKEGDDGSFVEFGPGLQWVQVDLLAEYEIYAVLAWHFHAQARVYHDVIVQVSDDPDFVTGVKTIYNNDDDNSAKMGVGQDKEYIETYEGRLFDGKGAKARYVRLYSNGNTANDMNHMIEVEVYGRPVAVAKSANVGGVEEKLETLGYLGKGNTAQAPAPAPAATQEMVPLDTKLPKPRFVGTPHNIKSRNLGASTGEKRPPLVTPTPTEEHPIVGRMASSGTLLSPVEIPLQAVARPVNTAVAPVPPQEQKQPAYGWPVNKDGGVDQNARPAFVPRTPPPGTEAYTGIVENCFLAVADQPLSTFGVDVDTASYANVRRFLSQGTLPPVDAVRIEEMINYFKYDYPEPQGESPFAVNVEVNACPWNPDTQLARIGIKGKIVDMSERAPCSLVFLIDVSGSMGEENKLPLLVKGLRVLTNALSPRDRVGIVTYSDNPRIELESTLCQNKEAILGVLDRLHACGCTNGADGIRVAYEMARRNYTPGGMNRVVLATDGDFNVGMTATDQLVQLIQNEAKSGVFFNVLGFGTGNLKDTNLLALADKGNGQYAYIDSFKEARRVLLDQIAGTLFTIAKDVKIQVEFNPAKIGAYRLIGYEKRALAAKDFNDDTKDAGEIGAGHTVTALYEIVPAGKPWPATPNVDPLKYQPKETPPPPPASNSPELMTVKLRFKMPSSDPSRPGTGPSTKFDLPVLSAESPASANFKFASAVTAFGMILRNSAFKGNASLDLVLDLAQQGKGNDLDGARAEFVDLVKTAKALAR